MRPPTHVLLLVLSFAAAGLEAAAADAAPTIDQRVAALEHVNGGVFDVLGGLKLSVRSINAINAQQQQSLNLHHDLLYALYAQNVQRDADNAELKAQVAALTARLAALEAVAPTATASN